MTRKICMSMVLILLVLGLIFLFKLNGCNGKHEFVKKAVVRLKKLEFKTGEILYLKKITRGISADHSQIIISGNGEQADKPNIGKDVIFDAFNLFYKQSNDTLYLYVYKFVKPPYKFESKIHLVQVEVSNPKMMELFDNNNYKLWGIEKFD